MKSARFVFTFDSVFPGSTFDVPRYVAAFGLLQTMVGLAAPLVVRRFSVRQPEME